MSLLSDIKRIARDQCANFCGNGTCLIEPDGESTCTYYRDADKLGHKRCMYYEHAVLPATENAPVEVKYWAEVTGDRRQQLETITKCARCREPIVKRSSAHQYCDRCKEIRKRDSDRESKRRQRAEGA